MHHRVCRIKYYNNCLFYNVQPNFIAQTGDPTGTGRGGESVYGYVFLALGFVMPHVSRLAASL